jgi:predicted phosphodiesterase
MAVVASPALRVALISDIHGNAIALEAVLRDITRVGVDRTICLGDTATLGPSPLAVLEILRDLGIPCITGNHDAFLLEPDLLAAYTQAPPVVAAVDWCREALPPWAVDFVRDFVPELDVDLGTSVSLQLFHGTPRSHMEDLLCSTSAEKLEDMLGERRATVMAGGHTHIQMLRQHRGTLVVNPGSVGAPFKEFVDHAPPTIMPYAEYATVDAERGGVQVTLRRVEVDRRALFEAAAASSNPLGPMLAQQYAT